MYLLEAVSHLVTLLTRAITFIVLEAINALCSVQDIIFGFWIAASLLINIIWFFRLKFKNNIILPMVLLCMVNIILDGTSIQIKLLSDIKVVYPAVEIFCKFFKWIETTCVMMATGLIIYTTILFRNPQTHRSEIKKSILQFSLITPILTFLQMFLFETYVGTPNDELFCNVGIEDETNKLIGQIKPFCFFAIFSVLLMSDLYLYYVFKGTPEQFLARSAIKFIHMDTYCVLHIHAWFAYFLISFLSYFFPMLKAFVDCFHMALMGSGLCFSIWSTLIMKNVLEKFNPDLRLRRVPPPSLPSGDTTSIELSEFRI